MELIKKEIYGEEYYEVEENGMTRGEIYEDAFGGWRPYNIWGHCYTVGRPAHRSPLSAMGFFLNPE